MTELTIGISGINAIDNPGPGVGIARSLKEDPDLSVKTIGFSYDALEPGMYMDWLIDRAFILPYPSGESEGYLERLHQIQTSCGLDMVIPNLDVELPLYIKYQDTLAQQGIKTFLPSLEQFRLRGKDRLDAMADLMGIGCPQTEIVGSSEELTRAVDKIGLPVMIKGLYYKANRAYTMQEAHANYTEIVSEWGYPVIVQQVVTGEEMNVVGVGDGQGHSLGLVGIKKLSVTALGKIWNGVTVKHSGMLNAARKFVEQTEWRGGYELECLVDGDEIILIEINPRLPAWSYFATGVGVNLPGQLVRKAFDLPVTASLDYEAGKMFIRYTYELVTDMARFQNISMRGEI